MAKHVFVLGAGASREAGAPLMGDFLDRVTALRSEIDPDAIRLFTDARNRLKKAHSKAELDLNNLETFLGAVETARVARCLGIESGEDDERVPRAIRVVLAQTLELTMRFEVSREEVLAPACYRDFVGDILKPLLALPGESAAVITFNYDVGLDYALFKASMPAAYGLDGDSGEKRGESNAFPLLKLHGSLNWAFCETCRRVRAIRFKHARNMVFGSPPAPRLRFAQAIAEASICDDSSHVPQPCIAPPTHNKLYYAQQLRSVWQRAAEELRTAEHIYVVGYSLPASDAFFRDLFAAATIGETEILSFRVFDPDKSVPTRFASFLGQMPRPRLNCDLDRFGSILVPTHFASARAWLLKVLLNRS